MKDLGTLHHFLGITVEPRQSGLLLHQRLYALDILDRAGMTACKPCSIPVDTQVKLVLPLLILLLTGALLELCSTSPSSGRISHMPFSRSVFICMICGSHTLLR
jgi:hypothetical protein